MMSERAWDLVDLQKGNLTGPRKVASKSQGFTLKDRDKDNRMPSRPYQCQFRNQMELKLFKMSVAFLPKCSSFKKHPPCKSYTLFIWGFFTIFAGLAYHTLNRSASVTIFHLFRVLDTLITL